MSTSASGSSGRAESAAKSRWAQLARRGEQPAEAAPELRAVPVRPPEPATDEHHLGDRLSAYLDGELGHDSRERVQAHLATCPECLAEADEGRAVKHLLTHTGTPAPSSMLMARLRAVAALPEDERGDGPGSGALPTPPVGTLGGTRLTGGSFGRGAGASFGGGALGAEAPIPGIDPRAQRPHQRPFGGSPRGAVPMERPLAALAEPTSLGRPAAQRGRRFVFAAAAGAFSVAAVTLGGVGSLSGLAGDEPHNTTVTPVSGPGSGPVVPMSAELSVDFPMRAMHAAHPPAATQQPQVAQQPAANPVVYPYRMLR